jgi:ATP citrate (pro-S)-lyase
MARKKIREYDSKRLLKEHLKRLAGIDLTILSAQVSASASASPPSRPPPDSSRTGSAARVLGFT